MKSNKGINIIDTAVSENITEITADIAEASIDQFIDNDFLKDIPILGIGVKSYSIAKKITDAILLKKIVKFLLQLKNISDKDRQKFLNKFENKKERTTLSEKLLVILDKLDEINKATIIGNLFKAYIQNDIDKNKFLRISFSVSNTFIDDLLTFKTGSLELLDEDAKHSLTQSGMLVRRQLKNDENYPGFDYKITITGSYFREYG